MLDRLFGGDNFLAATRGLDATSLRQQVVANNLANVNTPGYKRQEVQFESQLAQALQRSHSGEPGAPSAVDAVRPTVSRVNSSSMRADGNNVDLETEMVSLATNTMDYEVLTQSVAGYFTSLKAVINGR